MIMAGVGRVGRTAELRTIPLGTSVCGFPLAFDYGFGERKGTTWIDCTLWGQQAERLVGYIEKGKQLEVVLSDIAIEEYEHNGQSKSKLKAKVIDVKFVAGSRSEGDQPQQRPQAQRPAPSFEDFEGDGDDDIPF